MKKDNKKNIPEWDTSINPMQFDLEFYKDTFPIFAVPKKGFLYNFVDYACKCSDAPLPFNLISGFVVLATVCDNLFYQFGDNCKKLHLWAVLIASTNFYRKSQSANSALKILGMISPDRENKHLYPTDFSLEKLMIELSEKPSGIMYFDEWGGTLARWEKNYNLGIKEFLTQMFEGGFFKRKLKGSEDITISNPHINMLCATTVEWWISHSKEEDIAGGFSNRFIYCWMKTKARKWDFPPYKISPCEQIVLRDELFEISKISGEITFSPEARQKYRNYYFDFETIFEKKESSVKNLYARLPLFCLKLACLYAINNHPNNLEILTEDMNQAIMLSKWLLSSSYEDTSERLFVDNNYKTSRLIMNRISNAGKDGIDRSHLYLISRLQARQLDDQIKTLLESGEIRSETILNEETNRKQTKYYTN